MQILEKIVNIIMQRKMGLAIRRKMKAHGELSWYEARPAYPEPDLSSGCPISGHICNPNTDSLYR